MSNKPIFVITGGTGLQGGSVLRHAAQSQKFHIRVLTRNIVSQAAKNIALLFPEVELCAGNANDPSSMEDAFVGASYAFLVTSFWDPDEDMNPMTDLVQGKNYADVCLRQGVNFVIWSSQPDVHTISNGNLQLYHMSNKNRVESYLQEINVSGSFIYAGHYFQNWQKYPWSAPYKDTSGKNILPCFIDTKKEIPWIDIEEDFGKFVMEILNTPDHYKYKRVNACTEFLSHEQMAEIYSSVTDEPLSALRLDPRKLNIKEIEEHYEYLEKYYSKELYSQMFDERPLVNMGNFERWLRKTNFRITTLRRTLPFLTID